MPRYDLEMYRLVIRAWHLFLDPDGFERCCEQDSPFASRANKWLTVAFFVERL